MKTVKTVRQILNGNKKSFDRELGRLLTRRKKKIESNSISVANIIKDVKKNLSIEVEHGLFNSQYLPFLLH